MKKLSNWRWLMLLFAAVAISASVTACGGDDDDDKTAPDDTEQTTADAQLLIGTWVYDNGSYGWGYTFKKGGNGVGFEFYNNGADTDRWPITWKLNGKRLQTTDADGDHETFTIKYIDDEFLSIQFEGEESVRTLERVTDGDEPPAGQSEASLRKKAIGLWRDTESDWTRFNTDGSGFVDASDRYGTEGDHFKDFKISYDKSFDEYDIAFMWAGTTYWDTIGSIRFSADGKTMYIDWGSGYSTYYKQ